MIKRKYPKRTKTNEAVSNSSKNTVQKKSKGMVLKDNRSKDVSQKKANNTGLPETLKSGIENLSGIDMSDTKVHYNSSKPAQLNAHAYTQGNQIHLASGQEKHLPHEAWHVVQQKQGRVKPTMQMKGKINVNDDVNLEKEADHMGTKALQTKSKKNVSLKKINTNTIIQRIKVSKDVPESITSFKAYIQKAKTVFSTGVSYGVLLEAFEKDIKLPARVGGHDLDRNKEGGNQQGGGQGADEHGIAQGNRWTEWVKANNLEKASSRNNEAKKLLKDEKPEKKEFNPYTPGNRAKLARGDAKRREKEASNTKKDDDRMTELRNMSMGIKSAPKEELSNPVEKTLSHSEATKIRKEKKKILAIEKDFKEYGDIGDNKWYEIKNKKLKPKKGMKAEIIKIKNANV